MVLLLFLQRLQRLLLLLGVDVNLPHTSCKH
jgi:hypothetical protein